MMNSDKKYFFLILGPSGVGKSTIIESVLQKRTDLKYYPSYTTRLARPSEVNGVDYWFVDEKKFAILKLTHKLAEWDQPHKTYYYGIPIEPGLTMLQSGQPIIREIAIKGLEQILASPLKKYVCSIFIYPDNISKLGERLVKRGEKDIKDRVTAYEDELMFAKKCNFIVESVDGHPDFAIEAVIKIIDSTIIKTEK